MSADSSLIASLVANATLTAVIGTRLEPAPRRQGQTAPDLTWHRITTSFEQPVSRSITGTLAHYQFDAWDSDNDGPGAEAVIAALKTALLAYTSGIHSLAFLGEFDVPEPYETGLAHRALQVAILS